MKKMVLMAMGAVMSAPIFIVAEELECVQVEEVATAPQLTELDQLIDYSFETTVNDLLPMVLDKVIVSLQPYLVENVNIQEIKEKLIQAVIDALYENKKAFVAFMKDHYTVEEIRQMIEHQNSPLCQKVMREVLPSMTTNITMGIGLRLQHLVAHYIQGVEVIGDLPEVAEDDYAAVATEKRIACENIVAALHHAYEHTQLGIMEAKEKMLPFVAEEKREQFGHDLEHEWVMIKKMMTQYYLKAFNDCCTVDEMNQFVAYTQTNVYKKTIELAELQKNILARGLEQKMQKVMQENAALFIAAAH